MSYSLMIFIRINSRVLFVYISSSTSDEARLDLISLSLVLYQVGYYYFQEDSQIGNLIPFEFTIPKYAYESYNGKNVYQ